MSSADHFGLEAIGCAGVFTVSVLSADDHLLLSVESSDWTLRFELLALDSLHEMLGFLRSHTGQTAFAELTIGSFLGAPVMIVKDDESSDRFFLKAFRDGHLIEFTLVGEKLSTFTDAVAQAAEEFKQV